MKIKKILKLLMPGETVRIWGNSDSVYLFEGSAEEVPHYLTKMKAQEGPNGGYIDVRYGCVDCDDHIALFVDEEEDLENGQIDRISKRVIVRPMKLTAREE